MAGQRARLPKLASLFVLCLLAGGATGADWEGVLERPVSPGSVALLIAHAQEPAVQEYWLRALRDAQPEVRAAASRLANVAGAVSLGPEILTALEKEADLSAALEEIRAVAALVGPKADARLIELAAHEPRFVGLVARALARARGAGARVHLEALRETGLVDAEASAWASSLRTGREAEHEPVAPILATSLSSLAARMRVGLLRDTTRLPGHYPPGLVEDLFAVTECRSKKGAYGAGLVGYRRDGRPKTVTFLTPDSPCQELVRSLILAALSPPRVPPEHTALLVVPLAPGPLSCAGDSVPEGSRAGADTAAEPGGEIERPRKTLHVPPEYPEAARQARVQGTVTLEARISRTGCVEHLKILKEIPLLDLSAFVAVSQWRYAPTTLDAEAVPVVMKATVNYRLH